MPFHHQNKTNKAVTYGNICIFCSHYYRTKARQIQGLSQGGGSSSQVIWPVAPWCSPTTGNSSVNKGWKINAWL